MDVEKRSIEFIPESERYGTPARLFSIWFSSNMQVTALIIGALGVLEGLNVFWGIAAALLGSAIGTIFMAAHSAQGPQLGIPQMIQSRAQFGVLGAGLPLAIIVFAYVLFTAANDVVMRSSVQAAIPVSDNLAIALFGALTLLIAFIGYELIHRMAIWMSILSLALFLVVAFFAARHHYPVGTWSPNAAGFRFQPFVLGMMQAASWSIGFAPYVADYSRYLPAKVKTSRTFWYSYHGQFLGSGLIMSIGAALGSYVPHLLDDPGRAVAALLPVGRWVATIIIILGVLEISVLNIYSAYMSATTIFTGFRGVARISKSVKFLVIALVSGVATLIAMATQYNFSAYFSDILVAQLYFIVPWTAINLCDFYLVRLGKYSVPDIYCETGQYGRFNFATIAIMLITLVAQIPFMSLSFYVGPIAQYFGADVTIFISLFLPGLLYYFANRKLIVLAKVAVTGQQPI
jgi:NCS1 family nucleobase:cation symporter-1